MTAKITKSKKNVPTATMPEILAAISRLSWTFAWTLADMPERGGRHEYTTRRKAADENDYIALFNVIQTRGVIERWKGRPGLYLYPGDGWRYWDLTAKMKAKLEYSRHINCNRIEEAEKLRKAGLIS